jgi:hypothetical protein
MKFFNQGPILRLYFFCQKIGVFNSIAENWIVTLTPANTTITMYNASVVKIYNATCSLARFKHKK